MKIHATATPTFIESRKMRDEALSVWNRKQPLKGEQNPFSDYLIHLYATALSKLDYTKIFLLQNPSGIRHIMRSSSSNDSLARVVNHKHDIHSL